MPKVTVYNQTGSQVGEIELAEAIFGIEPNEAVLFEAVMMQRASLRQGTHKVKLVLKFAVVVVNHGVKRNWTCSSRVYPFSSMAWWWYGIRIHQEAMRTNFLRRFVV